MAAVGRDGYGISSISVLNLWEASDVDLVSLESHSGQALRERGITVRERDIFRLHEDDSLVSIPCLVVVAGICPPCSHREYLDVLIQKYFKCRSDATLRRLAYENMTFEAVLGQLPLAVAVSTSRRFDTVRASTSPTVVATLKQIPGYNPKMCAEFAQGANIPTIVGGTDLVVKASVNDQLDPRDFIGADQQLNLVNMCARVTADGWRVLFLGDGDGSLALNCGRQVHEQLQGRVVVPVRELDPSLPVRKLGRDVGTYKEFYIYAKEFRIQQIMDEYVLHDTEEPIWPPEGPSSRVLQPHVCINTGMMWLFAAVVV